MKNAIAWFQIPVIDMERAVKFYGTILSANLKITDAMGARIAILPHEREGGAVGGALYSGEGYTPSSKGTLVLLNAGDDLGVVLSKVEEAGGKVELPKTAIYGGNGFLARFIDSEGNRVGLHSKN